MPEIHLSAAAQQDLDEIADYIAEDNPEAAAAFINAAFSAFRKLAKMPEAGRHCDFDNPRLHGQRCLLIPKFSNYAIFYYTASGGIEVTRVLHGARDLESLLG